jgi:pimeloyl-ACP methyl ester carboxylesterase
VDTFPEKRTNVRSLEKRTNVRSISESAAAPSLLVDAPAVPENRTNVRSIPRVSMPLPAALALQLADAIAPERTLQWALERFLTTTRRPASEAAAAFRASGEAFSIDLDGQRLAGRSWGAGPAVYFVHGWNGSMADFRHLVPAVVNAGFRAVGIEAPGHGESEGQQSSVIHIGRTLHAAVEQVGPAHGVVAHSLGGAAAAWAVAEKRTNVRSLILVAPAGEPAAYIRGLARNVSDDFAERMILAAEQRLGVSPEAVALAANTPRLPQPALIVHDTDDQETPIHPVMAAAGRWESATFLRTSGLGHRRILADAAVGETIVAFLENRTNVRSCMHGFLPAACDACAMERELYRRSERPEA